MSTCRRKPAFTKTELKTYHAAAREEGLYNWAVERTNTDGTVTRFICGTAAIDENNQSEWDKHETR